MEKVDAKRLGAYFLSHSSLGPIMLLLILSCQYQSVIKRLALALKGLKIKISKSQGARLKVVSIGLLWFNCMPFLYNGVYFLF